MSLFLINDIKPIKIYVGYVVINNEEIRGIQIKKIQTKRIENIVLKIWKKREAQNEKIMTNMLGMCGELQGIADTGLPELESLGNLLEIS